jgi:hypothetical protein
MQQRSPTDLNFKFVSSGYSGDRIATGYGRDGPGIESRWGQDFPHPSRPALRPTQLPIQWVPRLSLEVKRKGCGVYNPPHPALKLKQE